MIPESYMEWPAQSKGEDPLDDSLRLAPGFYAVMAVAMLTSNPAIMGTRASSPLLRALGWATAAIMTAAGIGMFVTL